MPRSSSHASREPSGDTAGLVSAPNREVNWSIPAPGAAPSRFSHTSIVPPRSLEKTTDCPSGIHAGSVSSQSSRVTGSGASEPSRGAIQMSPSAA